MTGMTGMCPPWWANVSSFRPDLSTLVGRHDGLGVAGEMRGSRLRAAWATRQAAIGGRRSTYWS